MDTSQKLTSSSHLAPTHGRRATAAVPYSYLSQPVKDNFCATFANVVPRVANSHVAGRERPNTATAIQEVEEFKAKEAKEALLTGSIGSTNELLIQQVLCLQQLYEEMRNINAVLEHQNKELRSNAAAAVKLLTRQ